MSDISPFDAESSLIVRNGFVRGRNVLVSEADLSTLFVDYYLHLQEHELKATETEAHLFKDLLAAMTLHVASRPRNEVLGWTVRYAHPVISFFLAGDSELGTVTGRFFTENVREEGGSELYQDLKRPGKPVHRSMVDFDGSDAFTAVNRYYEMSEQRPGRFFHLEDDRYALVTAHPDYDEAWFAQLDADEVRTLSETEDVHVIETRAIRWACGCSHEKILEVLKPIMKEDPERLFGEAETLWVNCPRCAARYAVTREAMEGKIQE